MSAIGSINSINILKKYCENEIQELAETCQLAVKRLTYLMNGGKEPINVYGSIDPTPSLNENRVDVLRKIFLDDNKSIYERYEAMFALRDLNNENSIQVLCEGIIFLILFVNRSVKTILDLPIDIKNISVLAYTIHFH